jgi:serine/threonine protein kinase
MAVVYKAYHPALDRHVALKVLPQQFTFDEEFVERFLREARAVARLSHRHIITVYDVGEIDGTYFIVMEYLEGPSLADLLRRQRTLPQQQAVQIASQVASALDYAHERGFIHRDVKPSNVLLGAEDEFKLTDFGIARAREGTRLTQTGTLLGTPEYMSPEQARGLELDHRSDVYSLSVVVYQMLTGRAPFQGETMAVLHGHVYEAPDLSMLPDRISAVVARALAKEPAQRYVSAGAFAEALGAAAAGTPEPAKPVEPPTPVVRPGAGGRSRSLPVWLWATGLGVGAVLLVLAVVLRFGGQESRPAPTQTRGTTPTPLMSPSGSNTEAAGPTPRAISTLEPATSSTSSRRITYMSDQDGDWEVYIVDADGGGEYQLTDNDATDGWASISPDGQKIAFVSSRDGNWDLYVMDPDGSNVRRLTDDPAEDWIPMWSPDGSRIAFFSDRDGNYEIYTMDPDGSNVVRLTDEAAQDWAPVWSPDGRRIAFMSDRDGNWDIYVMNSDGSGATQLTTDPGEDWSPDYSPDGGRIVFTSDRDGDHEIYIMNADGSGIVKLTDNDASEKDPSWSPDGALISFYSDQDGDCDIYVLEIEGGRVTNLTDNLADEWYPAWEPGAATALPGSESANVTATPPATQAPAFYPMPLGANANAQLDVDFLSPPTGDVTMDSVPFRLTERVFKSQASPSPNNGYPIAVSLSADVPRAYRLHLLLTAGNGFSRFQGEAFGRVLAHCGENRAVVTELRLGRDLREWHVADNVVSTASRARQVWSGVIAGFPNQVGHVDMLSLDLPPECRSDGLTAVEVVDDSVNTVDSLDPAFTLIGVTVEYYQ